MTKKSVAAAVADAAPAPVDAAELPRSDVQSSAETEGASPPVTSDPAEPVADVPGRALVDIPEHGLKCGAFGVVPANAAPGLVAAGYFDPKAERPKKSD